MTNHETVGNRLATSLGPDLERQGDQWVLDLERLPIVHGLSVLSRALADRIVAHARTDHVDITIERRLHARENPELVQDWGIAVVKVVAEVGVVADLLDDPATVERTLRALLGNLQRSRYREALLASRDHVALLADFTRNSTHPAPCRFLLEHVPSSRGAGHAALRITIENPRGRRLDLTSIRHLEINDVEERTFIAGSTRIAQTWTDLLRREAERGRWSLAETRNAHQHLFLQLDLAGFGGLDRLSLTWTEASVPFILEADAQALRHRLKRVLLALEDRNVRSLLARRDVVRVKVGASSVYLDISHLGRILNLSLGARRPRTELEAYLGRMPALRALVARHPEVPLHRVRVLLVHHITSDVLGLVAALRRLGCRDLTCLFVAYAGEAPPAYLEALLTLPSNEFRALALTNLPDPRCVEGHYQLSSQYSVLEDEGTIATAVRGHRFSYFDAMRAAAMAVFLRQLEHSRAAGERLLIIEDGGYLAPWVNQAARRATTLGELWNGLGRESEDLRPLGDLLENTWIGSVEHTKNGHDLLRRVEQELTLYAPALSIAVSRLKLETEAREVATSVLNAIENVLHAEGRLLSRRNVLVLGSRGAIGGQLVAALRSRLVAPHAQLLGVDLVSDGRGSEGVAEGRYLCELDRARWRRTDLVVGVTGTSVLGGGDIEDWVLAEASAELYLVSGSTKTVEFADVVAWMDKLLQSDRPMIGGHAVTLEVSPVTDPHTGRSFGSRYGIAPLLPDAPFRRKDIIFVARLTPANFLFYGVPTELIDEVLAQLLSAALGLVRQEGPHGLPARLLAVDREIDSEGQLLASVPTASVINGA